ncbi:MAG TPA: sensor domain-containing diguanylate cyclase [Actinomycetota bacterium]|nr:sensor domain-containing diguanylate cyclase [Actinomycetota bacterium]
MLPAPDHAQAANAMPLDLLDWTIHRDPDLNETVLPAMSVAESLLIIQDGVIRVALDREVVRGHVLATSAGRHQGEPVLAGPLAGHPLLDSTGQSAATSRWLARWHPQSVIGLPLEVDGHTYGALLALTFQEPCGSEALSDLRMFATQAALRLALRAAEEQLLIARAALDATGVPTAGLDPGGRVRVWNLPAERTFGISAEDARGRRPGDVVPALSWAGETAQVQSARGPIPVQVRVANRGGRTAVSYTDLTAQTQAEEETAKQRELSEMVLSSVPGRACILDRDGLVVATNSAFRTQGPLGRGRRSALTVGADYAAWLAGVDEGLHDEFLDVLAGRRERLCWEVESTYRRRPRWTELHAAGAPYAHAAALVLHIDITERKQAELDLEHRATHDPLTGLPNRLLLVDRLQHALSRAARSQSNVGVLYCDLDRFKEVNTQFGHAGGDQLLVEVGHRLQRACRTSDTVSRVSGDEFVVLLEDVAGAEDMEEVANRILDSLAAPVELEDGVARTGASIGMTITKGTARSGMANVQRVVRQVDAAMYAAKEAGRNRFAWFSPEMLERAQERPNFLEAMARRLLNR